MPPRRDPDAGLRTARTAGLLEFSFAGDHTGLLFERVEDRVSACLSFGGSRLRADVSIQPGAIVQQIDQAARRQGLDANRWRTTVLRELREWSGQLDWCPPEPGRLLAAIGALTHPLLVHVYAHPREALGEVPRWARDVLRCAEPMAAARALVGDHADRRLARAMAASLLSAGDGGIVQLGPLALAVIGRKLLTVDEIANVLEVATTAGPDRWPSVDEVHLARQGLALYPPARRAALLVDVARRHDSRELAEAMRHLWWVRDRAELPLPMRLDHVRQLCRRLVPVVPPAVERAAVAARPMPLIDPDPAPVDPLGTLPTPTPVPDRRPAATDDAVPRGAPTFDDASTVPASWPVPATLADVHERTCDGLRFMVPTSGAQLASWGITLDNCLGSFSRAAAQQRSWLIGIEEDGELIGCVEVTPSTRQIRQALGRGNRPLSTSVRDRTTRALVDSLVLDELDPTPNPRQAV